MVSCALERRMLQATVAVAACVPVMAGTSGIIFGTVMLGDHTDVSLDSHFRYLSGLLCGLGLYFWYMLPTIEQRTLTVRVLTFMVFVGGVARLVAALTIAVPSLSMVLAIGMELVITPILCLWQSRIARLSLSRRE